MSMTHRRRGGVNMVQLLDVSRFQGLADAIRVCATFFLVLRRGAEVAIGHTVGQQVVA